MLPKPFRAASVAALLMLPAVGANAATFNLFYQASTGALTAVINGTLQPDGDTVIVSSVSNAAFDGTPGVPLTFVAAVSDYLLGSGSPPTLTLSGSSLDLYACESAFCLDGFVLDSGVFFSAFVSGLSYGNNFENYDPANYSLTAAVPLPAAGIMLLTALGGIAALRRKRAACSSRSGPGTTGR